MDVQTSTPQKTSVTTIALTAAATVVATLGMMATTVKPGMAAKYVPGHYALYSQWVPAHINVGPVPHYRTLAGEYYVGHYGAFGCWVPGHYVAR